MLYIALGFLVLGLLVGGAGMRKIGRLAGRAWRPGVGMLALAAFVAAAILGVRGAIAEAAGVALVALVLSMTTRRTTAPRHSPPTALVRPDVQTAASILGVAVDASEDEVQAAYLRLIRRVHPDVGGAVGLAAQLNAARDTMLQR